LNLSTAPNARFCCSSDQDLALRSSASPTKSPSSGSFHDTVFFALGFEVWNLSSSSHGRHHLSRAHSFEMAVRSWLKVRDDVTPS